VHAEARPAVTLLEQAGLRWNGQIDPFDAGPFYAAATDDVGPVRDTRELLLRANEPDSGAPLAIASAGRGAAFRAVACPAETADDDLRLPRAAWERLCVSPGERIALTPLPTPDPRGGTRG
jgi:arginine/ornithine N-succinyltransferase beta subunit